MFVVFCDILEEIDDRQVLRAYAFALSALDAIRCLAMGLGEGVVVGEVDRPSLLRKIFAHIFVVEREVFGDAYGHGATVCAVMARCAWNGDLSIDDLCGFEAKVFLFLRQGFEVLHVGCVVFHLFEAGHAGENDHNVGQ